MKTIAPVHTPSAQQSQSMAPTQAESKKASQSAQAFETMFITSVVDEMIKTVDMGSSMGGHAAEMWRSVFSEALAESLVSNGGIGISNNIRKQVAAYSDQIGATNE